MNYNNDASYDTKRNNLKDFMEVIEKMNNLKQQTSELVEFQKSLMIDSGCILFYIIRSLLNNPLR